MKRFLWLFIIVVLFLICTGCGDTFRPVIIPNPPKFPDPRSTHTVMSVNDNGQFHGSNTLLNVTGDSIVGVRDMGIGPVHAVQQSAGQVLVVNRGAPGAPDDSLTRITFSGSQILNTATISLPVGSAPDFVAVAPSDTTAYVTLPKLVPDPIGFPNDNAIAAVNASGPLVATIRVGNNPVAIAVTPDKNKVYVANQGDNTVSAINAIDRSARLINGAVFTAPLWVIARTDSQRVFVLNGDGTLTTLDTTASSDTVIQSGLNVGAGAKTMIYDSRLNRLYVPSGSQVTVVDVGANTPRILKTIAIDPLIGGAALSTVAAAALPDGTRAYVASFSQLTTTISISAVAEDMDNTRATYTYTLISGPDLQPGMGININSAAPDGFDGNFIVTSVSAGTFKVQNTTAGTSNIARSGSGANFFPQVTAINTSSNTIKATTAVVPFPAFAPFDVPICATTRFRFTMAAAGDSSRVYLASCDGANINVIDTATDTYLLHLPAPGSLRAPIPPSSQPPPQNPIFLIAGP